MCEKLDSSQAVKLCSRSNLTSPCKRLSDNPTTRGFANLASCLSHRDVLLVCGSCCLRALGVALPLGINEPFHLQASSTMLCPAEVQNPERQAKVPGGKSPSDMPVKYYPAPTAPGHTPRRTALSPKPRFTDKLFDMYPPPQDLEWSKEDLELIKAECRGQRMLLPSPTLEQLQAWNLSSYEQFCIMNAYEVP